MDNNIVIRAWKDGEYRQSLSEIERELLPVHPAGLLELTDAELAEVAGGKKKKNKKKKKNRKSSRSRSNSRSRSRSRS